MITRARYQEIVKPVYDTLKIAAMIAVVHLILRLGQSLGIVYHEVRVQTHILEQIRDQGGKR